MKKFYKLQYPIQICDITCLPVWEIKCFSFFCVQLKSSIWKDADIYLFLREWNDTEVTQFSRLF